MDPPSAPSPIDRHRNAEPSASSTHTHEHEHYRVTEPGDQSDGEGDGYESGDDLQQEIEHYEAVVGAFAFYPIASSMQFQRMERQFSIISEHHQRLLQATNNDQNDYITPKERFVLLHDASQKNARFFEEVLDSTQSWPLRVSSVSPEDIIERPTQPKAPSKNPLSGFNADKVHSTLYQLSREWGREGAMERMQTFQPILSALNKYLPVTEENRTSQVDQYTIYPWIHKISNVKSARSQLKGLSIPDVDPSSLPSDSQFGCAAGDFLEIAPDEFEQWDAVATCFFLDTANNIVVYLEAIHHVLKEGGYWINLGPLLYHYQDSGKPSLELTLDQVIHAAKMVGFEILEQNTIPCNYTRMPESMMNVTYDAEFWVARKAVKS